MHASSAGNNHDMRTKCAHQVCRCTCIHQGHGMYVSSASTRWVRVNGWRIRCVHQTHRGGSKTRAVVCAHIVCSKRAHAQQAQIGRACILSARAVCIHTRRAKRSAACQARRVSPFVIRSGSNIHFKRVIHSTMLIILQRLMVSPAIAAASGKLNVAFL